MPTKSPKHIARALREYLRQQADWKTISLWLLGGTMLLLLIVWFREDIVHEIEATELWIESHGALGWAVYLLMIVVLTSVFVPFNVLAMAGGAMFGIHGGIALTFLGVVLTAVVNYFVAGKLLQTRIQQWLQHSPKLLAIQQAVQQQGLRLQLLLRMSPVSAVTVSYILGATGVRFRPFLLATIGLLPSVILNVYFGHTASCLAKACAQSSGITTSQVIGTVIGLIVCVIAIITITRIVARAVADLNNDTQQAIEADLQQS